MRPLLILLAAATPASQARAADLPAFAGPALGTTYRVTLAEPLPDTTAGEIHRAVDRLLAGIDRSASTWRDDSDVSRFHRAAAGEWIEIGEELAAVLAVARQVHDESGGAFDVTAGPLVRAWRRDAPPTAAKIAAMQTRIGMNLVEARPAGGGRPPAIRRLTDGVELDLGGIGPGYAVDRIGELLGKMGSTSHLVELGGEVRAWGVRGSGDPWRVRLRGTGDGDRTIELPAGTAVATASSGAGRTIVDPRTGAAVPGKARSVTVSADTCGRADAWAVAAIILDLQPSEDGLIHLSPMQPDCPLRLPRAQAAPAPSTTAAPPAATRAAP